MLPSPTAVLARFVVPLAAACASLTHDGSGSAGSAPGDPARDLALQPEVTRAELEAHVRYLASDELAGRSTGSEGGERAARYLAAILGRYGVEPAGDGDTFLQSVPLIRTVAESEAVLSYLARTADGVEERVEAESSIDFDSVTGVAALEDLHVVVARSAEDVPREAAPNTAIFLDAGRAESEHWLEAAGHPGGAGWALAIRAGPASPGRARGPFRRREQVRLADGDGGAGAPTLRARGSFLARLRKGEVESLTYRSNVLEEPIAASNVVGRIPGKGLSGAPGIAEEAVVVSAHYDHLAPAGRAGETGTEGEDREDRIFNGADDDASGCAAVLEIAGAISRGEPPARTVVLLLATGEEIGLLGTRYYLDHPAVPLESTVANLNVEMIGRPDALAGGPGKVWLTGYERTDLGPACAKAELSVAPDARPEQHFFERSDNIAFVMRGIVGQTFSSYDMHEDYHHVTDEADRLDYEHMEGCARTVLGAVRLVVDGAYRPGWLPGQEIEPR